MKKYRNGGKTTVTADTKKILRTVLRFVKLGFRDKVKQEMKVQVE